MRETYEPNWTTADNKTIPFSEVTHQHLSNIYWYHLIFQRLRGMPYRSMQRTVETAKNEINKRFKGKILKWKPVYLYEVTWLQELGMIVSGISINIDGEIFNGDKKIGIIVPEKLRKVPDMN